MIVSLFRTLVVLCRVCTFIMKPENINVWDIVSTFIYLLMTFLSADIFMATDWIMYNGLPLY